MIAAVNILQNKFGNSKKLPMFAVRTSCRLFKSRLNIFHTAYKAALLRRFYVNSLGWFAKLQGRAASFVIHIPQICSKMRTSTNLSQTPNVCSASTQAPCKRATTVRKSRTIQPSAECRPITPYSELKARETESKVSQKVSKPRQASANLYQITLNLVVSYSEVDGRDRYCSVIYTDIYQASTENEALGLAVATARSTYGTFKNIDLKSLKCNRTYNILNANNYL